MLVNELFCSIDGEGKRAGELTAFIRFCGCNCNCSYCDSRYTWSETGKEMTPEEIFDWVVDTGYVNVTITGGEPLLQKDLSKLVTMLAENGNDVNIETNGTLDPVSVLGNIFYHDNVFVTMDYKCESSGQRDKMIFENFICLRPKDVLKFVVGNKQEMEHALSFINELSSYLAYYEHFNPIIYFSPIFGKIQPSEIVEFMKEKHLVKRVRVQLQLHKYFWNPEERGV